MFVEPLLLNFFVAETAHPMLTVGPYILVMPYSHITNYVSRKKPFAETLPVCYICRWKRVSQQHLCIRRWMQMVTRLHLGKLSSYFGGLSNDTISAAPQIRIVVVWHSSMVLSAWRTECRSRLLSPITLSLMPSHETGQGAGALVE